uniref:Uncharacterized protein n=1 Tax=Anguilla anguilla TaxID=7936 RepID=A0A0E9W8H9_ANGAN
MRLHHLQPVFQLPQKLGSRSHFPDLWVYIFKTWRPVTDETPKRGSPTGPISGDLSAT